MYAFKLVLALALLACISARHVWKNDPYSYILGHDDQIDYSDLEDQFSEREFEAVHPGYLGVLGNSRVRRQATGSMTLNSDGSVGTSAKIPLVGNDKNVLSGILSSDMDNHMNTASRGFGLALDNVNGHGLTVMKESVPGFGDRLTGAGRLNVFHNANHDVSTRGFVTRNMPNIPQVPNFNTVGGGVDYMYKNKVGASLGMASTPLFQRKDFSAMGNLNVFRNPSTSVDLSAGFKRFDTPFMSSGWKPNYGLSFSRNF